MIDPPLMAFRRRALELKGAAERERDHDLDGGALLMFYAVECALKFIYMSSYMLRTSGESRGAVVSAKDMGHDLVRIINELRIPRRSISAPPVSILQRTGVNCAVIHLHQAWRYGEKLMDSQTAWDWLSSVMTYCEEHL